MMLTIIKILNQIGGVGVILTVGGSFIKYNSKKGWKCRKNASNREKFFFLFLKMLLATIIATVVFICIRYIDTELLKEFISKSTFDGISKIFLLVFDVLVCIVILQNEWNSQIDYEEVNNAKRAYLKVMFQQTGRKVVRAVPPQFLPGNTTTRV